MFITQERSHGWSASRRNRNDLHGKNCWLKTLWKTGLFAIFARNQNFRRKLRNLTKSPGLNAGGPQSHNKQGKAEGDDGRMQLLGLSLISRKGDFWTSQENSKAHRDERNEDERKLDQSIDRSTWIREANKPTMRNAIKLQIKRNHSPLPHRNNATCRATLKKSPRRNKNSKAPKLRSISELE